MAEVVTRVVGLTLHCRRSEFFVRSGPPQADNAVLNQLTEVYMGFWGIMGLFRCISSDCQSSAQGSGNTRPIQAKNAQHLAES